MAPHSQIAPANASLGAGIDRECVAEDAHPDALDRCCFARIADLVNGRALALLACEGIATAADVRGLCARTASYSDVCPSALPTHIDLARAALVGQRRRFSMRRSPHVHRDGELKPAQLQAV
jgi:hypothetical protein